MQPPMAASGAPVERAETPGARGDAEPGPLQSRLAAELTEHGIVPHMFARAPANYYQVQSGPIPHPVPILRTVWKTSEMLQEISTDDRSRHDYSSQQYQSPACSRSQVLYWELGSNTYREAEAHPNVVQLQATMYSSHIVG